MDEDFLLELCSVPEEQANNFQHLCSRIFSRNEFADCTLCCADGQLQAHRVILAASSNYMYNMLSTTPWPTPCSHPMLFFKSVTASDMKLALEFIYTGKVQIPKGKLSDLMNIARELGSSSLIKAIEKAIHSYGVELFRKRVQTVDQANKTLTVPAKRLCVPASSKPTQSGVTRDDTQEILSETSHDQYDALGYDTDANINTETFQNEVKVEPEELSELDPSCLVSTSMTNDDSSKSTNQVPISSAEQQGSDFGSLENYIHRDVKINEDEEDPMEESFGCKGDAETFTNTNYSVDEDDEEEEMPITVVNLKSLAENKCDIIEKSSNAMEIPETLPANCPWCLQVFTSITLLQRHIKTHVGNYKPYSCQYCPSSFARSAHLKRHIRTHTGEKPFVCNYCSRAFSRQDKLKTHLEKHLLDQHIQNAASAGISQNPTLNVPRPALHNIKPVIVGSTSIATMPTQKPVLQVSSATTTTVLSQPPTFQYFMNEAQETWQGSPDFQRISQGIFAIPGQMTISTALTPSTTITPISSLLVNTNTSTS